MIKLVLSDMDSTLIPLGMPHVSMRTLVAIQALQAEGIEFAPSTGRGAVELSPFFLDDHRYFQTGILSNGKKVYLDGEVIDVHYIDTEDMRKLDAIVQEYPNSFITLYPDRTTPNNPVYCVGAPRELMLTMAERYRFLPIPVTEVPEHLAIGCTIASGAGQDAMDEIKARAAKEVPGLDIVQPYPGWCDVMPHGVNKASGMAALVARMGVSRDEVVVFGDGENDIALFNAVENSVAVANAMPVAKAAAHWHVGACEDDGVAIAMEQIAQAAHTGGVPAFMRG